MQAKAVDVFAPPLVHEKVLEIALALPGELFLDTPAGHGSLTNKLVEAGKTVVAGDMDIRQFEGQRSHARLRLMTLDLNEAVLPLEDDQFDVAISIEGIEHLENQWSFIRNLSRVVKRRGYIVITTPNLLNFRSRVRYFLEGRFEHFKRPLVHKVSDKREIGYYHISPTSFFELRFMLENCGFSIDQVRTNVYKYRNIFSAAFRPLLRLSYAYKNYRDAKRGRGDRRALYETVMSDAVYYGESIIILARNEKAD